MRLQNAVQNKMNKRLTDRICAGEQKLVGRSDVEIMVLNAIHCALGIAFEVNDGRISAVVSR